MKTCSNDFHALTPMNDANDDTVQKQKHLQLYM